MKTYRQIVKEAGALLKNHEIGKNDKIIHLWSDIEWREMPRQEEGLDAQLSENGEPLIRLYPALLQSAKAPLTVLREFALVIKAKGGARAAMLWEKKLDLPTPHQVETARQKLMDPHVRSSCKNYSQVNSSYPDKGSAVDKLVFIHCANALLANNIPFEDSKGVDIKTWGPTVEYCNFKKYHSLVPMTSAYCPPEIHQCYGRAFVDLIGTDLRSCRESTVAAGLRRIIKNIASRLEAFPPVAS